MGSRAALAVFFGCVALAAHAQVQGGAAEVGRLSAKAVLVGRDLSLKPVPRQHFKAQRNGGGSPVFDLVSSFAGEIDVSLPPGQYQLVSDKPVEFEGASYSWRIPFEIQAGKRTNLALSNDNAESSGIASSGPISDGDIYRRYSGSVFKVMSESGHGSGFLVDPRGLVLTNHHVIDQSEYLAVRVNEASKYSAVLLASDSVNDIAVLRVNPVAVQGLEVLDLVRDAGYPVAPGDRVLAIGSPLATDTILTTGIVSKVEAGAIYSDVNINHGNSGGPLLNARGQVLGITTFALPDSSGPGVSGIVRIHLASRVLAKARALLQEPPPSSDKLPVESSFSFPAAELREEALKTAVRPADYRLSAGKFNVTFVDPVVIAALQIVSERDAAATRKRRNRRKGSVISDDVGSDFYEWRRYVGDYRPVVTIQATPELGMPPGSWLAASLGATSGLRLWFKADFGRMELVRDGQVVEPINPGRIRQVVDESVAGNRLSDIGYFGAYEYPPEAFQPGAKLTLRVWEQGGDRVTERNVSDELRQRIWSHFEPYFASIKQNETTVPSNGQARIHID